MSLFRGLCEVCMRGEGGFIGIGGEWMGLWLRGSLVSGAIGEQYDLFVT